MTAQATLFDFAPRAVPLKSWSHDHDHPHRWIYRTNAEAVVKDLGKMPSGDGLWPSLHINTRPEWHSGCNITAGQYRGSGGIWKEIWVDGRVRDTVAMDDSLTHWEIEQAWIENDTLHLVGVDGIERTLDVVEDSECDRCDIHPFDPARHPEDYIALALSKGVRGDDIITMLSIHSRNFDTVWPLSKAMDVVWSLIPVTGVVPKLDHKVHHITEFLDIHPVQYTCQTCTRKRPHKGCQCGNDPDTGYCMNYVWNGTPLRRLKKTPGECDDDDDMEDCCA